jgi:hypothetical protein
VRRGVVETAENASLLDPYSTADDSVVSPEGQALPMLLSRCTNYHMLPIRRCMAYAGWVGGRTDHPNHPATANIAAVVRTGGRGSCCSLPDAQQMICWQVDSAAQHAGCVDAQVNRLSRTCPMQLCSCHPRQFHPQQLWKIERGSEEQLQVASRETQNGQQHTTHVQEDQSDAAVDALLCQPRQQHAVLEQDEVASPLWRSGIEYLLQCIVGSAYQDRALCMTACRQWLRQSTQGK